MKVISANLPCAKCGTILVVEVSPARISNTPETAIVTIALGGRVQCPVCHETMQPRLVSIPGFAIGLEHVPDAPKIITPAHSGLIPV